MNSSENETDEENIMRKFIPTLVALISGWCQIFSQSHLDTTFTNYFRRSAGWTAGDATISVALPDRRVIWLFGDSYIDNLNPVDTTLPCLFNVRNCLMVQDTVNNFRTYLDSTQTGVNRTTFKLRPDDTTYFWPGHGFTSGDTAYIFLYRFNSRLEYQDTYIAKLRLPLLNIVAFVRLLPSDSLSLNGVRYGNAIWNDSSYVYVFGSKRRFVVHDPYVARIPNNQITQLNNLNNWEFFTGTAWSSNPAQARPISTLPVSSTYNIIKINNVYHIITQENSLLQCNLGKEIYSYSSNSISGPYINQRLLYTVQDRFHGRDLLSYNAYAHPRFTQNNELLISYNVNDPPDTTLCAAQCRGRVGDRRNADTYRAKFIRVPLSMLTSVQEKTGNTPKHFELFQAFPNPFNPSTEIRFELPEVANVSLVVIDVLGRKVADVVNGLHEAGYHSVTWNASDVSSGVYFARFIATDANGFVKYSKINKLVLIR